ncbi:hypothetical protein H0H87_012625 [Tephrocybe sp. NHM501043]|nr:hypothetical protein H0H87_012625 [Tephrocybe sp. NHM501043]
MAMPSRVGQKRSRPNDKAQRRRDGLQLDFLAGLRVIENLGTDRPTNHDNSFFRDTPMLYILNFISLLAETDSSRPDRSDIAVAVSADQGHIRLILAKANGEIPTDGETKNVASFIQTLRDCLKDNALGHGEDLAIKRFTRLIAQRHLPELFRKLSQIGTVGGRTPKKNWERFCSLLPLWHRANPRGERSHGFVTLAKQLFGLVHGELNADEVMVGTMKSFILHDESTPVEEMTSHEKPYFTKIALESSVRMVNSNFFQDVISKGPFHNIVDPDNDHQFLNEMYRRINDVAQYLIGLEYFAYAGIPYIVKALGQNGLEQFLSRTGGIVPHWVVRSRRNLPRTLFWGTRPQDKVRRLLESKRLAIDDFEPEEYDNMAQQKELLERIPT